MSSLTFDGIGSWNIIDLLMAPGQKVYLKNGTVNTNGNPVTIGSFESLTANSRTLNCGSSIITINGVNGSWTVNNQIILNAGNSTLRFESSDVQSQSVFVGGSLNYGNIIFMNDAIISGSNSFNDVFFNAGNDYLFQGGETQTFIGNLLARGCSGMITMGASGGGQANIAKNNGNINVYFVKLSSMKSLLNGSNEFNAYHSIDDGDNEGINIYVDNRDMYWINGTGYWSDTTHWTSSPNNDDADCVPIDYDNVFFNEASFTGSDSVQVDLKNISCNNMTWTGNDDPFFINSLSVPNLTLYGSLEFSANMTNHFTGTVLFADTLGGKTIKTSDKGFKKDISFDGENGAWTIIDSLKVEGIINFLYGSLYTGNNFVSCQAFRSDSAFIRALSLGSSEFIITNNISPNSWSLNSENMELSSGTSIIELKAAGSSFYNFGGDSVIFHNVLFSASTGAARLNTYSDTYAKFHNVTFKSNGTILSSNTFDTLSFSPGNYYDLPPGATQTINYEIFPTGDCQGPILIKSTTNGNPANIISTHDTIRVNNASIRDINALGEVYYIAENSVDLGNNFGWDTVMVTAPGKLFWVGGLGDWSDKTHWSLASGGAGGECIPTAYDTVIFDQNSFSDVDQYVNIDLNNALAHDMDWSDAGFIPEFKSGNSGAYLRIYGSLKLNPDMEFTFPGYISFESSDTSETIITENVKFYNVNNNVYFDGIGGEWTLLDSLQLGYSLSNRNNIYFYNGNLNTNGQYLDCFGFYSNYPNQRIFSTSNSDLHVLYEWNVDGNNLNLSPNTSLIQIDSGFFIHKNGNYSPYHDVHFNAVNNPQYLLSDNADSLMFREVIFSSKDGKLHGNSGSVYCDFTRFKGVGQINQVANSSVNVYVVDTLFFNSIGKIFGNDTIRKYVQFDSTGYITGDGLYQNALFKNDGNITGNNIFDTLSFNSPFTYLIGSQNIQTIHDQFNIRGNNCEFIKLKATEEEQAEVYKETGSVYGDFIEMEKITALGGALFDAGQFSKNINNSNEGWLFYDPSLNYSLGPDTSILEGETINICAQNFNGNSGTTYEWRNCVTGDIISDDSCLLVTERGYYCLTVFYDDGPGCIRQDTIFIGCYLDLLVDTTNASCNGYSNGAIEIEIEIGVGPFNINWYSGGTLIANTQNVYNLSAGYYYYTIEDSQGCISGDTVKVKEPLPLEMDYESKDACFGIDNGGIGLEVTGGTNPYNYSWSNGSTLSQLTELSPGEYTVYVSDDNACPSIFETIIVGELDKVDFQLEGSDLLCYHDSSGDIEIVNLVGGTGNYTTYEWVKDGQFYSYLADINNLQVGEYGVTVIDDYGCLNSENVLITEPDSIALELVGTNGITNFGSIDLTAQGGIPPYSYLWNTGSTTEDIDPLGGGLYYVDVTDGNLCKASDSIFIEVHFRVYAPTAFSPNGDLVNDEFQIFGLGTDLREYNLMIFNRYGQTVFETNDPGVLWNGRLNNTGQELPIEAYTWIVELTYIGGEKVIDKGNVSLLR